MRHHHWFDVCFNSTDYIVCFSLDIFFPELIPNMFLSGLIFVHILKTGE